MEKNRKNNTFDLRMKIITILVFILAALPLSAQKAKNSITIFGSAEYGLDTKSIQPAPINYRDGFFHSAGFYYRRSFTKWYLQPGICYTQILFSDEARTPSYVTYKVHRLGLSVYAGYYLLNNDRWSIGVGGGVQALYNIAAVQWSGSFNESSVVHLTGNDFYLLGLEFNAHGLFAYQFHPKAELYAMPFVNMNAMPVFKTNPDYTLRMGLTMGIGYTF